MGFSQDGWFSPWEPKTLIFRGYNPYIGGLKPSFFMVLGSKGWFITYFDFPVLFKDRGSFFTSKRDNFMAYKCRNGGVTANHLLTNWDDSPSSEGVTGQRGHMDIPSGTNEDFSTNKDPYETGLNGKNAFCGEVV